MTKLTEEQLAEFNQNGFIILESAFNAVEVAQMREEADFISDLMIKSSIANGRQSRRLDIKTQENGNHIIAMAPPLHYFFLLPGMQGSLWY